MGDIYIKQGDFYIMGCFGDDDGHMFPLFTEDRDLAMQFKDQKRFMEWAEELSEIDEPHIAGLDLKRYYISRN